MTRIHGSIVRTGFLSLACVALLGVVESTSLAQQDDGAGRRGDGPGSGQREGGRRGGGGRMGGMMGRGVPGIEQTLRPYYFRRDLAVIVEHLDLDEDQSLMKDVRREDLG